MAGEISQLFRDIEEDKGTHYLMRLTLKALQDSVRGFKGDDFIGSLIKLIKRIANTEPKIALVIDQFYSIIDYLYDHSPDVFNGGDHKEHNVENLISIAISQINFALSENENKLWNNGADTIEDGDLILIHSHSRSVIHVLIEAKRQNKEFEVILAEQEFDKTISILKLIKANDIPVKVVPEYMLSHIDHEITKVFLGVLTLNSNMNFVADAGTVAIVSEFRLMKKPIYIFMTTGKFSLWKTKSKHHTYKTKNIKCSTMHDVAYERIKFTHDRVPIEYTDYIITEEGRYVPKELEKRYWKKFKEREDWNLKHNWKND